MIAFIEYWFAINDFEKLKFLLLLPFCSKVISFSGVSDKSVLLDWVIFFKKKLVMQWQGTDVIIAVDRKLKGEIKTKYIDYSMHLASAFWFIEELKDIVDEIIYAPYSYVNEFGNDNTYEEMNAITYLIEGKEEFYGWKELEHIIGLNPTVKFIVIGTEGKNLKKYKNVVFKGWVSQEELLKLLKRTPIFIRATEHDGKALTVSQAFGAGCEVIWTSKMENCHFIEKDKDQLQNKFLETMEIVSRRQNTPNPANIKYAQENLLRATVLSNYVSQLKKLLND